MREGWLFRPWRSDLTPVNEPMRSTALCSPRSYWWTRGRKSRLFHSFTYEKLIQRELNEKMYKTLVIEGLRMRTIRRYPFANYQAHDSGDHYVCQTLASLMSPLRNENATVKLITFLQLSSWPLKSVNKPVAFSRPFFDAHLAQTLSSTEITKRFGFKETPLAQTQSILHMLILLCRKHVLWPCLPSHH